MSTSYIIASYDDEFKLTRDEFIKQCTTSGIKLSVSEDDAANGLDINSPEADIGCELDGTCWASFNQNILVSFATYCDSINGDAAHSVAEALNIPIVSEHDDTFSRYNFGIDITTTAPIRSQDGWNFYQDGEWISPHFVANGDSGYHAELSRKSQHLQTEDDWAEFLEELVDMLADE